jgi:hypothetical protein
MRNGHEIVLSLFSVLVNLLKALYSFHKVIGSLLPISILPQRLTLKHEAHIRLEASPFILHAQRRTQPRQAFETAREGSLVKFNKNCHCTLDTYTLHAYQISSRLSSLTKFGCTSS